MTPAEIVGRLDDRFGLLAGGRRRSRDRHQTLRRTVDWSFDLLDETEKMAMRRLSIFGGSFDLAAAEAVAAAPELMTGGVLDVVSELVAKSLLVAETAGSQTRFRFLETLRQYGEDRLEGSGELEAVTSVAAAYLVGWATRASQGLLGPDHESWFVRTKLEMANLRRAIDIAFDHHDIDTALGIVAPFHHHINGPSTLVLGAATAVAEAFPDSDHTLAPAVLTLSAEGYFHRGDYDTSRKLAQTADDMADRLKIPRLVSTAVERATMEITGGNADAGYQEGKRAVHLAIESGELHHEVAARMLMIYSGMFVGALEPADCIQQSRALCELADEVHSPTARGQAHWNLGAVLADSSPHEALEQLAMSMEVSTEGSRPYDSSIVFGASVHIALDQPDDALKMLGLAFGRWIRDGERPLLEWALAMIAHTQTQKEPRTAAHLVGQLRNAPNESLFPEILEQATQAIRAALGDEAEPAFRQGEAMNFDDVADLAARFLPTAD